MKSLSTRITQNTLFLFLGQVVVLALNTITLVILARAWDASLFGIFSYALVFVGFFTLLPDFGMKPILIRELSRNKSKVSSILANALVLKLIFSFVGLVGLWIASVVFFKDTTLQSAIFILSFILLLSSKNGTIRVVFESFFHAQMEMQFPVLFQLLDAFFQMVLVGICILFKIHFSLVLLAYALAHIPGFVYTFFCIQKYTSLSFHFQWEEMRWLLTESFPLFLYLVLVMFYERIDVLYVKGIWGNTLLGIYSSAFRLTAPLVFIPTAVSSALYPALSEQKEEHGTRMATMFSLGLKILFALGTGIGILGVLFGKPVFFLLFGDRYVEAVFPFQCLLLAQGMMFILFFLVDWNNARNRQSRNTWYIFIMLLVALGLQWVWIRFYGIKGAGIAKLLLNAIGLWVLFWVSLRDLDAEKREAFFHTVIALLGFVGIALLFIFFQFPKGLDWVFWGIVFLGINYWLFSKKEKQLLKNLFRYYFSREIS